MKEHGKYNVLWKYGPEKRSVVFAMKITTLRQQITVHNTQIQSRKESVAAKYRVKDESPT
jgi:hypothetical protein